VTRLHDTQIDLDNEDVRQLIDQEFPEWKDLPLTLLESTGTVNRIDLLGDNLVVRIPIVEWGAGDVPRDAQILPMLAGALPVQVPALVAHGGPAGKVPWDWGVYSRLPGRHPVLNHKVDEEALAAGLIELVATLRMVAAPSKLSSVSDDIADQDEHTRPKVQAIGSRALADAWAAAVQAPPFAGRPTFIHGDLMPANFLLTDDATKPRLTGVLDWASAGMGDPARDLLPAWSCLTKRTRSTFLSTLGATDDEIARARGYGARKVGWGLNYYRESLPEFAAALQFMLDQIEEDLA
jgi:aminoglycoside phosphotransferase (APT) family kinase protein